MDIMIGSNSLRNTSGVFVAHGQEQMRVELGETDDHRGRRVLEQGVGRERDRLAR